MIPFLAKMTQTAALLNWLLNKAVHDKHGVMFTDTLQLWNVRNM